MELYLHHRRKLIWLHWVAASTAGAGTIVVAWGAMSPLVWPPYGANDLIESHIAFILLSFLLLICVAVTANTQHEILQQVGISKTWVPSTIVGLAFGVFVGILYLIAYFGLFLLGIRNSVYFSWGLAFTCGAGLGFVQCLQFATSWDKRRVWILLNGIFPLLLIGLTFARVFAARGPLEVGLCIGLVYGVITGPCLAWMAPTAAEAEEERLYRLRIYEEVSADNRSVHAP